MTDRDQARILVIDDDEDNVTRLRALLRSEGYTAVESTTDRDQAWSLTVQSAPDLILLCLTDTSPVALEALEQLSPLVNGPVPVPVLVLAADAGPGCARAVLAAGAREFLATPFEADELALRIHKLVDDRLTTSDLAAQVTELRNQLDDDVSGERLALKRRRLQKQIETAINDRMIFVAYQPIVELAGGTIAGMEGLARFVTPVSNSPDVWFRQAHDVGLGVHLELATIDLALSELYRIHPGVFVAVNLTETTMRSPGLATLMARTDRSRVVLDLSEGVRFDEFDGLGPAVASARENGARVAVDDAGRGYASFAHLLAIRPELIKVDRSLTNGIERDPARRAQTAGIVAFAREIGAHVVAVGVETRAEYETMAELGVSYAQGFYIARPEPLSTSGIDLGHLSPDRS